MSALTSLPTTTAPQTKVTSVLEELRIRCFRKLSSASRIDLCRALEKKYNVSINVRHGSVAVTYASLPVTIEIM